MKHNKYVMLLLMLLVSIAMHGQYNPSSPAEPGRYYTLTLESVPADAGGSNSTASYLEGKKISLRANSNKGFKFLRWEKDGEVVSTSASFTYTMPAENVTLVAHYEYAPSNPSEPSKPVLPKSSRIYVSSAPSDGGSFNVVSGNSYQVGTTTTLEAYCNYDFKFDKWTDANGKTVSTSASFKYTVQENDTVLVAHFIYAPGSPGEPSEPRLQRRLTLTANIPEAGSFNIPSGNKYVEGSSVWLEAYTHSDFLFEKWVESDSVVSTKPSFNYQMPERDVELQAVYTYDPSKLLRLLGELKVAEGEYIYTGEPICPEVAFVNEGDTALVLGKDYEIVYTDNVEPGMATVSAKGILPYFGEVKATFEIQKWPVDVSVLSVVYPDSVVWYDGKTHELAVKPLDGMGECTVYYTDSKGNWSSNMPVEPEKYTVSLVFDEGTYYKGTTVDDFYTFEIALPPSLSVEEWEILCSMYAALDSGATWKEKWDLSVGIGRAETLHGVTVVGGHLIAIDLSDNGLTGEFPYEVLGLPYLETLNLGNNALTGNLDEGLDAYLETVGKDSIANLTSLNLSGNQLAGNVGAFASQCPNLKELKVAENRFSEVVPALSSQIADVDLTGQQMQKVVTFDWDTPSEEELKSLLPTISAYVPETQTYDAEPELVLADTTDAAVFGVTVKFADGTPTVVVNEGCSNIYTGENGDTIYCTDRNSQSTFLVKLVFAEGDANFTGDVDVLDLQSAINFAFGLYGDSYPFNHTAANLQKDTLINVQDVVRLVGVLLDKQVVSPVALSLERNKVEEDAQAGIYWEDDRLTLSTTREVASLEMVLSSTMAEEVSQSLKQRGFIVQARHEDGWARLIAYSLSGNVLPVGKTVLATSKGYAAKVVSALLADDDAQRIKVELNGIATGISHLDAKPSVECRLTDEGIHICTDEPLKQCAWELLNVAGRMVEKGSMDELPRGMTVIPCNSLLQGCYLMRLNAENGVCITVKVLLAK